VHQDLAPLARQLERELDRTKAELTELRVQMARSAGDAVPAGFKLVPVEPTEEMLRVQLAVEWPATYRDFLRHPASGEKTKADTEKEIAKAKKRWTAMLAAAPASANTTPARAESACRCRAQGGSTSESSNESCAATPTNTAPAVQPEKVAELWNQQADEFNQWSELGADEKAEWIAKLSWDSANEGAKGDQQ
jgi:hypothetical protein